MCNTGLQVSLVVSDHLKGNASTQDACKEAVQIMRWFLNHTVPASLLDKAIKEDLGRAFKLPPLTPVLPAGAAWYLRSAASWRYVVDNVYFTGAPIDIDNGSFDSDIQETDAIIVNTTFTVCSAA